MAVPIIKVSELSELGVINDGDYLTILTTEGYTRKIKFSTLKTMVNKSTQSYVDIQAKDGTVFRMTVNRNGELVVQNAEAFVGTTPTKAESGRFKGLMINMIYVKFTQL